MQIPPLLVSFPDAQDFIKALSDTTRRDYEKEIIALVQKGLPPAVSRRCIAVLFGYSPKFIGSLLAASHKHYRSFVIKKGKKKRAIVAPKVGLKVVQKWLGYHLAQSISFDDCVHGFVRNKSHLSAAEEHLNAKWVYSLDIKDFFPTTPALKVSNAITSLGYKKEAADLISLLCCYNGYLAQGSPASPFLSNLVFRELDEQIKNLALSLGVRYTRYADDLTFSGIEKFPEEIKNVKNLITAQGWSISQEKEHFAELPNRLKVHGILVHGDRLRVTKGYRNRIRAYKHLLGAGKISAEDMSKINGHISYTDSVDKFHDAPMAKASASSHPNE
jgi:RNA-directed DNA polymerase